MQFGCKALTPRRDYHKIGISIDTLVTGLQRLNCSSASRWVGLSVGRHFLIWHISLSLPPVFSYIHLMSFCLVVDASLCLRVSASATIHEKAGKSGTFLILPTTLIFNQAPMRRQGGGGISQASYPLCWLLLCLDEVPLSNIITSQ